MAEFIQQLEKILTLSEKYGIEIVLAVGGLLGMTLLILWLLRKFDRMFQLLIEVKSSIPEDPSIEKMMQMNHRIQDAMTEIMVDCNVDWCQLWQFHNGTHGIGKAKIPFLFVSLTHEVCRDDCEPMQTKLVQLPLSVLEKFPDRLINGDLIITQYQGRSSILLEKMLYDYGAKQAFFRAIRDENNDVIGFLGGIFQNTHTVTERRKVMFLNAAQRLSAVLATLPDA